MSRHRCLSSNLGRKQPFYPILRALLPGRITLSVSTVILLEYQEVATRLSGPERWRDVAALLKLLEQLQGNIRHVEPQYRFNVISIDPDEINFAKGPRCRSKFCGFGRQSFRCS